MNARGMLNWFLSPSFDRYNMSDYDAMNIARMICGLKPERHNSVSGSYEHIKVPGINIRQYTDSDFLRPVAEVHNILHNESPPFINHFLLHGSLADLNYVKGWSDLDTWVVIDDSVFDDASSLLNIRKLFSMLNKSLIKVDSIAHHGYIIVLASDLDDYSDCLLPVEVLRRSYSLYGVSDVYLHKSTIQSNWISKFQDISNTLIKFRSDGIFEHHTYLGEYLTSDMFNKGEGMYQLKYLIGLILSFPVMYYSSLGQPLYKADSFGPFIKTFPGAENLMNSLSRIRARWGDVEPYPYVPNRIPGWLKNDLLPDYITQSIKLLESMILQINIYNNSMRP